MVSLSLSLRSSLLSIVLIPIAIDLEVAHGQDIVIAAGSSITIDTHLIALPTTAGEIALSTDGRLFVDNFTVEDGASVVVIGPHPLRVIARGGIRISGLIDVSGCDAIDVIDGLKPVPTLSSIPEIGGAGGPGGGQGGNSSIFTDQSTSSGTNGVDGLGNRIGGGGGESGFGADPSAKYPTQILNSSPDFRRGAGGGGGRFGPSASSTTPAVLSTIGLVAQSGHVGSPLAQGALGHLLPQGGSVGRSPFTDEDSNNDFWGVGFDRATGSFVLGELDGLRGGSGGGGGGDAIRSKTYPNPNFTGASEDKGGAGGGGGGAIHLLARDRIQMFNELTQSQGSIRANGGRGARGQYIQYMNNFFTKSGSGGGGGSGGHIVLESSTAIDLGLGSEVLQARGGSGGPDTVPALMTGKGGDGGPGVIQLHAPQGQTHIFTALPLNQACVPEPKILIPRSNSR